MTSTTTSTTTSATENSAAWIDCRANLIAHFSKMFATYNGNVFKTNAVNASSVYLAAFPVDNRQLFS